jgi:hypothetical protein
MSLHTHLSTAEQAVIRNKWFTLVCIALLFVMFAYTHRLRIQEDYHMRAVRCYLTAKDIITGSNGDGGSYYTPDVWEHAKNSFNTCLLAEEIGPSRVPAFEDMFPYPNNGSSEAYFNDNDGTDDADAPQFDDTQPLE